MSKAQAYKVTVSFVCRPCLDGPHKALEVAKCCLRTRGDLEGGFSGMDACEGRYPNSDPVEVLSVEPVSEPLTAEEALAEIRELLPGIPIGTATRDRIHEILARVEGAS